MHPPVNMVVGSILAALVVSSLPFAALAQPEPEAADLERREAPQAENRWLASLAVTSGVLLQRQDGAIDSCLFANPANATSMCPAPGSTQLRPPTSNDDLAVAAYVGANVELMSPALPLPARPRIFLSGEVLPTFADNRNLAGEGDVGCIRGPEPGDPCAADENPPRLRPYGEDRALGQGSEVTTDYGSLTFGANLGVAFPLQAWDRQVRIKPFFGWLTYKGQMSGTVVDAACAPSTVLPPPNTQCTTIASGLPGAFRQVTLTGDESRRFYAIGPGLDVEVDTGRFGKIGTALYIGGRAYRTLGDRSIVATDVQVYPQDGLPLAGQAVSARWKADFEPWVYRLGVGVRFQWLGASP